MPVTADDLDAAVSTTVTTLRPATGRDWSVPAGGSSPRRCAPAHRACGPGTLPGWPTQRALPGWAVSRRWCMATTLPKVSG
jgi:hypothetical protein